MKVDWLSYVLGLLLLLALPARAAEPPKAVPTFECIGLYWKVPEAGADDLCEASYRALDATEWRQAHPLWFDGRNQEYRGSIVHLQPGTTYEIRLQLNGQATQASLRAQTWSESFPVGRRVQCPAQSSETLVITESGSPAGYAIYEPADQEGSSIDVANQSDQCIVVRASFIVLRGLTLKGARVHAILLGKGAHDVVIEGCDISGWGRIAEDGWGKDYDAAIYSKDPAVTRIIVQRNRMHHPRSNSNNWQQARPGPGKREPSHPEGPQAVCLWDSDGNHVIRYNTVASDDDHQYNDIFGAGENFSRRGFPNRDSDIYGNLLSHCWDDAIESEGANCNVRIWGNYITDAFVGVACASTSIGPLYVWRNVIGTIRESPGKIAGAFLKTSNRMGGGKIFAFHNTILQPASASDPSRTSGAVVGLGWGGPMTNVTSRNNILHVTRQAIADRAHDPLGDYDYDLFTAPLAAAATQEKHGLRGEPIYVPDSGLKNGRGVFALVAQSPGFDAGAVIPNFNDHFSGAAPDLGAQEAGSPLMEFGVDAYRNRTGIPAWFPKASPLPPPRGEVIRIATEDELLAAVDRLSPGGTILVADGRYKLPRPVVLDLKTNITLRSASGDAANVMLTGRGWESGDEHDDILHIARCEGVTIADLSFGDCRSYGIKVEAEHGPKDIHILNCRFLDIGVRAIKGSAAQDSNIRAMRGSVRGCYFENTKVPPANWLFGGDYIAAIDMMALEDWIFSENVFRNVKGRNGGGRAAIFIWVRSRQVVVERNLIENCDRGVAFGNPGKSTANVAGERLAYVSDGIIRNNFIVGGPDCGIELWYADRIKVINNTVWRPEHNWNRGIRIGSGTTDTEIVNNLVRGGIQSEGGEARVHHNLSGRLDGYFEDPASGSLALTPAATGALGQGIPLAEVTDDIRGRQRAGSPDIGAWQSARMPNFTSGPETAKKFGTHEIVLSGKGKVGNPFDTLVTVKFTPPSGSNNAVTVDAFYDGGNIWRARLYVTEAGRWEWMSTSPTDPSLDRQSGSFSARDSNLRGLLRQHKDNPRAWMTDDGRWFANISDTGYRLFHSEVAPLWQQFIRDAAAKGITCMRAACLGGWGGTPTAPVDDNNTWVWNDPWAGGATPDYTRFDLAKFQNTDARLAWIFDHYPQMYLQFILFSFKGYGSEGTGNHWASLPENVRAKTMRYLIARWAAFPNLLWLIVNDMHCDEKFPKNRAFVREVGNFYADHDPWRHLLSTGPNRRAGFPFTSPEDLRWCSYIYIEDANAVGADPIQQYHLGEIPLHVWMGEDYYEQDHGRYEDPRFFFRWLFWSWLLSGGSANYCGRRGPIDPYSMTGKADRPWKGIDGKTIYTGEQVVGLDSIPYLAGYLRDRNFDLGLFRPNDARVKDLDERTGASRPKLLERGQSEFLVYHPNALADGKAARVDKSKTARMRIDLSDAPGPFQVEWFRAFDGVTTPGDTTGGGAQREFVAPWKGEDVVLRLYSPRQ